MTAIVVTIPRDKWPDWLKQHGRGDQRGKMRAFHLYDDKGRPPCDAGDLLYVVALGKLRCVLMVENNVPLRGGWYVMATMIRGVTLPFPIGGFPRWRRRDWKIDQEQEFPNWRGDELEPACSVTTSPPTAPASAAERVPEYAHGKTAGEQGGSSA
jgi:hypothetical protein